ncbi:CinA family nicotinamide mononucleotide deamidase-related protein [Chloroflexota bacterium]
MKAEIVSIGTELLFGEIIDTNASYLAGQLFLLGIDVRWVSQVGDDQERLVEVLKRGWQRSDLILTSGGLGPTGDDLTREAIAEMLGENMEIDPSLERALRERFGRMRGEMPLSNLKQAMTIPSAEPVPNALGSAPGWFVERDGCILVAMPGPPRELQPMWQETVAPKLPGRSGSFILSKTLKTFGLSEGAVGELVSPLVSKKNPVLGIYAKPDGIHLRLAARSGSRQKAEKILSEGETAVRAALGESIWGTDNDTLEGITGHLLVEKGLSLALMEDYSGGWLAAAITEIPENPSFFKGGLVACSDEAKAAFGVSTELISRYGTVSSEVARAMAEAARIMLQADIGISSTAREETEGRPVGMAFIGIADKSGSDAVSVSRRKQHIAAAVLFELKKWLLSPRLSGK